MRRAALAALAILAGCGSDGEEELVVSAASSLSGALRQCVGPDVRLQFAGSDELAAQIRRGVRPDVYAAADTTLPRELAREGLLEQPVSFATNRLVLAVPEAAPTERLADVAQPGVRLAVGSPTVPVGRYTREVLDRLPRAQADAILDNVRTEEPDAKGIVGKLAQGAVDAGFIYATDVATVTGLRAIDLPPELEPKVEYGVGVRTGAPPEARAFVDDLLDGACADALETAGFGRP